MKTKISFLVMLFAVTLMMKQAAAQIETGIHAGLAASTFSPKGNLADNEKVTFSYSSGVFLSLPLTSSFAVQPELNYLTKGRSNETAVLGVSENTDYVVDYLQVPLQLQYRNSKISESGRSVFYFNAGPYAAFALNNERRNSSGNKSVILVDGKNNKTDWGLVLGLGFQTPVLERKVRFDLKYDLGLSEIAGQPDDYRTKCLSLTVGIVL